MKSSFFSKEFVSGLPADPYEAYRLICRQFYQWEASLMSSTGSEDHYATYLDIYGFLSAYLEISPIPVRLMPPSFRPSKDISALQNAFEAIVEHVEDNIRINQLKDIYARAREYYPSLIPHGFAYQFSEHALNQTRSLLKDLRYLVNSHPDMETGLKSRMIMKVDRILETLDTRVSSLDAFWGLLGESGIVVAKLFEDADSIYEKVRQIMAVVVQVQNEADGVLENSLNPFLRFVEQEEQFEI